MWRVDSVTLPGLRIETWGTRTFRAGSGRGCCYQMPQVSQRVNLVEGSIAGLGGDAGALLDGGSQLNAAQTVEMEVFGEAEFVANAGGSLTGNLCDER